MNKINNSFPVHPVILSFPYRNILQGRFDWLVTCAQNNAQRCEPVGACVCVSMSDFRIFKENF